MYQSLFDDININYNTQEKRITRDNFIQNIKPFKMIILNYINQKN